MKDGRRRRSGDVRLLASITQDLSSVGLPSGGKNTNA